MRTLIATATLSLALLAGCDETMTALPTYSAPGTGAGTAATVNDSIAGQLESATMNGNVNIWSYFPDVVSDINVLTAADRVCGGPGKAKPQTNPIFTVGSQGGRTLHTMTFICG